MGEERWLVTGASGQLGGHILRALLADPRTAGVLALTRGSAVWDPGNPGLSVRDCDLSDAARVAELARGFRPTHVAHVGAMTAVGDCFANPALATRINTDATAALADAAGACGARLVFSSTDMVFDGSQAPYREAAPPTPLSCYGRSKAAAEAALKGRSHCVVVRIPLMFGLPLTSRACTFVAQLDALRQRRPLTLFTDEFRTPIWLPDAARALIALARSELSGVLHLAGPERLSRLELIARCAALLGIHDPPLEPISRLSIGGAEPRPADLSLDGSRFRAAFPHLAARPLGPEALRNTG